MKTANKTNISRTFSWMNPKLEVRDTKKYGKGVFAKGVIKKDDVLAVFGGYVRTAVEESKLPKNFNDNGVQISKDLVITIIKRSELESASYFNHSCSPNAGFDGQIFLVAIRNIVAGEEVTFDYAMALSKSKGFRLYKIKCLCGFKDCRGFITDNDWKLPALQKKYNGYFQWYLQKTINNKKIKRI